MSLLATAGKCGDVSYVMTNKRDSVDVTVATSNQTYQKTVRSWNQAHRLVDDIIEQERPNETERDY